MKLGIYDARSLASSSVNVLRLQKGESKTRPAMEGSRSPYIIAVTAPMDLPQSPIVVTLLVLRRYSTTHSTSSLSYQPNEIYSPSLFPQPEKSKANTVMSEDNK